MLLRDNGRAEKRKGKKLCYRSANKRQKLQCRENRNPPPETNSAQSSHTNWLWNLADSETESESDADFWTFIWQMAYATGNICSAKWGWRLVCGRSRGWRIPTWLMLAKVNVIVKNCCCSLGKNHIACAMNYNVEHFNLYCGMWRLLRFSCFYPCFFFLCVWIPLRICILRVVTYEGCVHCVLRCGCVGLWQSVRQYLREE